MNAAPDIVRRQARYRITRRIIRDVLLRPLGFRLLVKPAITGLEHVPTTGPTLVVMNHIAFIDPVVVLGAVHTRWVIPMSKIENFQTPGIGLLNRLWGAYPVDRDRLDRKALQNTLDLLNTGHCILIAPEGTRQPRLIEAKSGFAYVATKTNAAIVPIGLEGTNTFGSNLKRLRRTHLDVRIGPAFRFMTNNRKRIPRDELQLMTQEAMYQLATLVDEARRGAYADLHAATTETLQFL